MVWSRVMPSPLNDPDRPPGLRGGEASVVRALVALAVLAALGLHPEVRASFGGGSWRGFVAVPASALLAVALLLGVATPWIAPLTAIAVGMAITPWPFRGFEGPGAFASAAAGSWLPYAVASLALVPRSPYGSWPARGRLDPGGGFVWPGDLSGVLLGTLAFRAIAIGLRVFLDPTARPDPGLLPVGGGPDEALGLLLGAFQRSMNEGWAGIGIGLGVLLLVSLRARALGPFVLLLSLGVHLAGALRMAHDGGPPLVGSGIVVLHLLAFDARWIRKRRAMAQDHVFYDGTCGLCHGAVRFILSEDDDGSAARFAPLGSVTFEHLVPPEARASLPDSIVVRTPDGRLLVRSAAILRILSRLGGLWRGVGALLGLVPRPLRDLAYDGIAKVRKRIAGTAKAACPMLPPRLRGRFEA